MKTTLEKILEEFEEKWFKCEKESGFRSDGNDFGENQIVKMAIKSFISQKFSAYAKEIVEEEREKWQREKDWAVHDATSKLQ